MKTHTQDFKEEIKLLGKQQEVKITYTLDNEQIELTSEDINSATPNYEGSLLKSVMKELDIDSNVNIPEGTEINFKYGLLVNGEYEYLDYGNYIVYTSEKQEDTGSYNLVCYDKMLYFMKDYESLGLTYPVTVREYIIALCTKLGLTFKNANDTFPNYDKQLTSDLFEGIGFTYRDIADDLAEVTASVICLNLEDEVELRDINTAYELQQKSGNPIHINSIEAPLQHFRLNGGSKQETREGYNLLDVLGNKSAGTTHTVNGITYTINADGSIKVEGTATENADYFIAGNWGLTEPIIELDGTYTLQLVDNTNTAIRIYLLNQSNVINSTYGNTTLTKTENVTGWFIRVNSGTTINTTIYPQLVQGGETKPYEQYGAMPSPEYPSRVETVGSNINEFDKSASPIYVAGSTATEIENGIRIATISSNQGLFCLYKIKDITNFKGKTFTVKANWIASASNKGRIILGLCDSNGGNRISGADTYVSGEAISYTIPDTLSTSTYLALWLYSNANGTTQAGDYVDYTDIKIEEGDKATAYSPYGMGSVEIDVGNKNLAEIEQGDINPTTGKENNATKVFRSNYIRVKNGTTYVWSVNKTLTNPLNIRLYDIDKNYIGYASFSGQKTYTVTNKDIAYLRIRCDLVGEETIDGLIVQIEEGNTSTDIVEHEQQTKIMPIQQEMLEGDYIENVEHHGWNKIVLDGTENIQTNPFGTNSFIITLPTSAPAKISETETIVLSTHFKGIALEDRGNSGDNVCYIESTGLTFTIRNTEFATLETFKAYLAEQYTAGTPVTIYYKRATPLDLELTEEQKEAQKINTYNNVTNINIDNELATLDITYATSVETIDEEYLKDTNVNFGEKYGPINSIVLSRAESDNVYLQDEESIQENGLCELKIKDNQIMNFNDRSDYLPDILNKLKGIEFYLNDFTSTGIMFLELLDRYNVKVAEKIYSCVMFNNEQDITQGLEEQVYTEIPETGETDYTKADKTDQKINQTNLIVDKQNQQIQGIITQIGDRSEKETTITADIDGLSAKVEQIEDVTNNTTGTKVITLENCVAGDLLELHIYGNNTVFDYLLPSDTLYPSNTLYPKGDSRISIINYPSNSEEGTETGLYELGVMEVLRQNGNVCDEYVLKDGQAKIIRRINKDGTVKATETIEDLGTFSISLLEGDNEIVIKNYSAKMEAKWAIKNDYTDIFTTKVEMNSSITQTAQEINLEVSKKVDENEIISKINQSAEQISIKAEKISLSGKTLNLEDDIEIISENFKVDKNGNMEANNGRFIGGEIILNGGTNENPVFKVQVDDNGSEYTIINPTGLTINKSASAAVSIGDIGANDMLLSVDGDGSTFRINTSSQKCDLISMDLSVLGNVTANGYNYNSLESIKKNIEAFKENAINIIKNADIYEFNYKTENDKDKKHIGFIIGKNYNTPKEVVAKNNESIDIYTMSAICWKAIQEQQKQIGEMQKEIEKLKGEK